MEHVVSLSSAFNVPSTWKIKARVIALWKIPQHFVPMSQSLLEMLLIDKKGEKMEAFVSKAHPIKDEIQEGCVYKISYFDVIDNPGSRRYTSHGYRLLFHSQTKIKKTEDDSIPMNSWSFLYLNRIKAVGDNFGHLVDVIGILTSVSREKLLIKNKRAMKMIFVDLEDNTDKCGCVLIGDIVETLGEYLYLNWVRRPILSLLFVEVRMLHGKVFIQSIPEVTRIYINRRFEEDAIIGSRFLGFHCDKPVDYISTPQSYVDMVNDMLHVIPRRSISDLISNKQEVISVVHAWIVSLSKGSSWDYISCICHSEVLLVNEIYRCVKCSRMSAKAVRRYRVMVDVFDGVSVVVFVLNNQHVEEIVGVACEELLKSIELCSPRKEPHLLREKILGDNMLFKIQPSTGISFNGLPMFDVMNICRDKSVIADFNSSDIVVPLKKDNFAPVVMPNEVQDNQLLPFNGFITNKDNVGHCSRFCDEMNIPDDLTIYSISSINQPIQRRPIKRKLLQEFNDVADNIDKTSLIGKEIGFGAENLSLVGSVANGGQCSNVILEQAPAKGFWSLLEGKLPNQCEKGETTKDCHDTPLNLEPDINAVVQCVKPLSVAPEIAKICIDMTMTRVGTGFPIDEECNNNLTIDVTDSSFTDDNFELFSYGKVCKDL